MTRKPDTTRRGTWYEVAVIAVLLAFMAFAAWTLHSLFLGALAAVALGLAWRLVESRRDRR